MLNALQKAAVKHLAMKEFTPPESQMSDVKWCELMSVANNTLTRWKKDLEFSRALEAEIDEIGKRADPFASAAREFALEQMVVQYEKAKGGEKRHWLKLIMENTEHVKVTEEATDYSALSDDELEAKCVKRGLQ